jgi:hypothetical protein
MTKTTNNQKSKVNINNKKSNELTLSTVIIATILILVLVVVIFIFVKNIGRENDVVNQTIGGVGQCIPGQETATCTLTKDFKPMFLLGLPFTLKRKRKICKNSTTQKKPAQASL